MGFNPASYSVNEGGSVDLIIQLSQAPLQTVTVQIRTMDQTAVGITISIIIII